MKGFRRSVGGFLHFLKAHVQRMARFFIPHAREVMSPGWLEFFPQTLRVHGRRAGFPFRVLVTFQFMVACADGSVRMPVFFVGVALSTGFPCLVLWSSWAVSPPCRRNRPRVCVPQGQAVLRVRNGDRKQEPVPA